MVNASFRLDIYRLLAASTMVGLPFASMPAAIAYPMPPQVSSQASPQVSLQVLPQSSAINQNPRSRQAQRRQPRPSPPSPRQARRRPRPPRRLPPNRVQPGGGLDAAIQSCGATSDPLTALVPVANPVFTTLAHPTFLFYLPDTPELVDYAEFTLLTSDEKEAIYTVQFQPTQAGIVSIPTPTETAYALEKEQAYHWYLNVYCAGVAPTSTGAIPARRVPAVNGWVQRLPEDVAVDEIDEAGQPVVWYDAIAQLAARGSSSAPLADQLSATQQQQWEKWLSAIGLTNVANVPIVGPISPL